MRIYREIRAFIEKGLLTFGFLVFSEVIVQNEDPNSPTAILNNTMKNMVLGGLLVTSLMTFLDKDIRSQSPFIPQSEAKKILKSKRMNSAAKGLLVVYVASIDVLKTLVSKDQVQYFLYPAFEMMGAIMAHRGWHAFREQQYIDGILIAVQALSTQVATVGTALGDKLMLKVSLLTGAGCGLILVGKQGYKLLSESKETEFSRNLNSGDEVIPLRILSTSANN